MYAVSTERRSASNPGYTSSRYQLNDMQVVNRDFSSRNKTVVLSNHCFKKISLRSTLLYLVRQFRDWMQCMVHYVLDQ